MQKLVALLTLLVIVICHQQAVLGTELHGHARVIDGDSLRVAGVELRLVGIDAPEHSQTCQRGELDWHCGHAATKALRKLVNGREIRCVFNAFDRYDRGLASCYAGATELNAEMLRLGMAVAYRTENMTYSQAQAQAKSKRHGLWRSRFVLPSKWRQSKRARIEVERSCAVKGNVNRDGEKIYHLPSSTSYRKVRIDRAQGDRCFNDETAAREAGFRAPRR